MILLVIEHSVVQLVRKMLQPQTVADDVTGDTILRAFCSLRLGFNSIVDEIFLFSQIFLRCHKASHIQIAFPVHSYLYYRRKGKNEPLSQIISEISQELNLTEESIEKYIIAVSTFKPKYNVDFYANDDEDDYYSSAVDSVDNTLDTERFYFKLCQQEKLIAALAELKKPEKLLIEYVYGICPNCLKNKEKKTLRETSLLLDLTEDGAEIRVQAFQNLSYIAMCNRVGVEGEINFCGQSLVASPDGDLLIKADETEGLIIADISIEKVAKTRKKRNWLQFAESE